MKRLLFAAVLLSTTLSINLNAQSNFDDLTLSPDTFWNGADLSGGFTSGLNYFINYYDTTYYIWSGFAYSSMTDSVTPGYGNMYSAIAGSGNNSSNYAVAWISDFNGPTYMKIDNIPLETYNDGIYVTNSTYAYYSMKDGDAFSKKFGGTTGDDPDWFKLSIIGYLGGTFIDSVEFYLADYRFTNNIEDYIIRDWTFIDLSTFSFADSVVFQLSSSDNGMWGMNTPAYFCIDDVDYSTDLPEFISDNISIYPNPANDILSIEGIANNKILIRDITGKTVFSKDINSNVERIDFSHLNIGIYIVSIISDNEIINHKIIKN